jgi:hypothetical protein
MTSQIDRICTRVMGEWRGGVPNIGDDPVSFPLEAYEGKCSLSNNDGECKENNGRCRKIPQDNPNRGYPQWRSVLTGSDLECPVVDRVKFGGIALGVARRIPLGPVTSLAGQAQEHKN